MVEQLLGISCQALGSNATSWLNRRSTAPVQTRRRPTAAAAGAAAAAAPSPPQAPPPPVGCCGAAGAEPLRCRVGLHALENQGDMLGSQSVSEFGR